MKKIALIVTILLCGLVGRSQSVFLPANVTAYGEKKNRVKIDSTLFFPTGCGTPNLHVSYPVRMAALWYDSCGNNMYVYDPSLDSWATVGSGGGGVPSWELGGNTGTTAGTDFIGTTDAQDLVAKANSIEQMRFLSSGGIKIPNTTGSSTGVIFKGSDRFIHSFQLSGTSTNLGQNLHIGVKAGNFTYTGSSGGFGTRNISIGDSTLYANTTGYRNTIIGVWAGAANTTGFENSILGANAFENNTTGRQNTAVGAIALENNTIGLRNTAVGFSAMQNGTTAERNTAVGGRAMQNVSTGYANVALGFDALAYNTTAHHNVAVGLDALYYSNGEYNTALGDSALWGLYPTLGFPDQKHMGYKNVALGSRAGYHLGDTYPNFASVFDTAVTFLGANASRDSSVPYTTSLKNSTAIGYGTRFYASNQVVIGNTDVTTTLLRGDVGIGTNTPAKKLHTVGTVRHTSLGSASADTTTYKAVGINSSGDIIPMTSWPAASGGGSLAIGSTVTSATAGGIFFPGTGGTLQQKISDFFYDSANNRLGIGTNSPQYPIHLLKTQNAATRFVVENQSSGSSAYASFDLARSFGADYYATFAYANESSGIFTPLSLNITTASGSTGGIFMSTVASAPIGLSTNNTRRMTITGAGNVGIGNTSPGEKLEVTGNVKASGKVISRNVIYQTSNASDADFTAAVGTAYVLPDNTADRTITLPTPQDADIIRFQVTGSSFHWDLSTSVTLPDNTTTVSKLDTYVGKWVTLYYDGANSKWKILEQ